MFPKYLLGSVFGELVLLRSAPPATSLAASPSTSGTSLPQAGSSRPLGSASLDSFSFHRPTLHNGLNHL